ncbi:MAG: TonB-dependent receptor domain-containing protein [Terriglobia bacterium]
MRHKSFWFVGAFAGLALVLASNAFAQELATMRVTVEDPTGAVIPGVSLTLTNTQTAAKRTATTGTAGLAVIASLRPGSYELTAEIQGFEPRTMPVQLAVGQVATLTITLGIAAREVAIEVVPTAEAIDIEKAELSQVIDTHKIEDLPIQGRQFIDFAVLTPSVTVGRSTAIGAQSPFTETVLKLSFAGVRESHMSLITLDGLDYTTSISGVQRVAPSQDWVQEFRVVSSSYTTDTGRHLGSIVNTVTKSGTNDLHGSLYEFFRNDKLNATNLLSAPGFDRFRFNQFGATLGGPIVRDKTFLFAGYEGQRRDESPVYSGFILQNIAGINAVKQFLGLAPEDLSSILKIEDYDKFIGKLDHSVSDSTFLNLRYLFNDVRKENVRGAPPGEGLPSAFRDNPTRDQTISGGVVHVASPTLTLDTSAQYGRRTFNLEPVGAGLEPAISIPNLLAGGGFVGSVRFYREQRVQVAENLTYTRGSHSLKFGGEFHEVWTKTQVPLFSPAFAIFTPDSFFGAPPFGQPTPVVFLFLEPRDFFGQQIPPRDPNFQAGLFAGPAESTFTESTKLDYTHELYGLYFQDQWKVRPNFTLTFGFRYDLDVLPTGSDIKIQGRFHPTDTNNIQPRISFAYAFNEGKGVLRGGYGIFTAPFVYSDILVSWIGASEFTFMNQPLLSQFADPNNQLIGFGDSGAVGVIPGPFTAGPAFANFVQNGVYPGPASPLLQFPLGYAQRDFPHGYSQQASLQLEHQIGRDLFVSAGYQYLHAVKLPVYTSINGLPAGTLPNGKTLFSFADPGFGFVLLVAPQGFSIYHAGTLSLRKAFSKHYSVLANYTWAKSIDISTTIQLTNVPENYLELDRERGISDNDLRHRFTLAFVAEAPNEWRLLRDFKLATLVNAHSARHFTIRTGFDVNGDGFPFSDRVGQIGRNTYKGDPFFNLDLRVQRLIPFNERLRGEFSVEFFNLFNVTNVEDVNNVFGAPDFAGPVPQKFGDGIRGPVASFGTPKFAASARQIQLSFRLTF